MPLVQYIHKVKLDYIVANDRGARLIGLAVSQLYHRLHGRLPTVDGTLRFRRFSHSNSIKDTVEHARPLVDEMLKAKEKPVVLFLDDWVSSGATKEIAQSVFQSLSNGKIDMRFGVFAGENSKFGFFGKSGVDIAGNGSSSVDWHDRPDLIGVDYAGTNVSAVRSKESLSYRRRMTSGIESLVEGIKEGESRKNAGIMGMLTKFNRAAQEARLSIFTPIKQISS